MGRDDKKKREFDGDELHWYALDVMRQKEYVAGHIFQRRGCMTFIPTEMRFRKKNRYTKGKLEVASAGIPGTIFVGFPSSPNWFEVMSMHLVNGVLSLDNRPHRIDTASPEWIQYRAKQLDGCMTIERQMIRYRGQEIEGSATLISVQGRGVIRTHANMRVKAATNRPVVIRAAGERARILGAILGGKQIAIPQAA